MSDSNNTQEFDNILFQVNGEKLRTSEPLVSQSNNMLCEKAKKLDFNYNSPEDNGFMSIEDFLDLVPANSYFH